MPDPERNAAVLVGNGLSIAFNPDLGLRDITEEVLRRFAQADGDDVVVAMREIADKTLPGGATSADDFELLVGAFGAESRTLGLLDTLAGLTEPTDDALRAAIQDVAEFAGRVHDTGVSHVLQVIAERSHAYLDDAQHLHDLVESLVDDFDGEVTFGNLNYDTLLLAALLHVCQVDLADLGHGWRTVRVTTESGPREVRALRRTADEFPDDRRVKLLHLHGSLTYWATRDEQVFAKLPREMLDGDEQWRAIREGTTNVRPVIVLANQRDKSDSVTQFPFSLAYEMFGRSLTRADHWLVIGYSFRDDPVNAMLRGEFINRDPKPRVHVVTHGEEPRRRTVERAFGWGREDGPSNDWLTIDRDGANGAHDRDGWVDFIED